MTLGERWADTELSVCTQSVCNIPSVLEMSGDVIFWNVCKKPGCTIITHMYTDTRDIRKQAWVKVSHPSLECKKDLLPFKTQFPDTRHMDQIVPCFFPPLPAYYCSWSSVKALASFPQALWQAWASSLFSSDKEGRGWQCFCLPVWEGRRRRRRWESRKKEGGMLEGKGEDVQQCGNGGGGGWL